MTAPWKYRPAVFFYATKILDVETQPKSPTQSKQMDIDGGPQYYRATTTNTTIVYE